MLERLLEVQNLDIRYGAIQAVSDVSFSLNRGEILAVLGANGAGKTSLLRGIQGLIKPSKGAVLWKAENIKGWSAPRRVRGGIVLVPEGRQIFITMTVQENLQAGAYSRSDADIPRDIEAIYERFPSLAARRDMAAAVLSGGEQQMLAIGRAMLAQPAVMMLDEPSLGLSPILSSQVFSLLKDLNKGGLTVLLVEQNTRAALQIAHRGLVLELGKIVMQGEPKALLNDERLKQAYLGEA